MIRSRTDACCGLRNLIGFLFISIVRLTDNDLGLNRDTRLEFGHRFIIDQRLNQAGICAVDERSLQEPGHTC
jgi:hypothetical protein